jgi:cytochrome c biogenesis protein CcdA
VAVESSENIVRALIASAGDQVGEVATGPGSPGCVVATDHYYSLARWLSLWTVLLFALGAATVIFLITAIWLLIDTLSQNVSAANVIARVVGIAASAVGGLVTGKGASFVTGQRKEISDELVAAEAVVNEYCGQGKGAEVAANVATFRLL